VPRGSGFLMRLGASRCTGRQLDVLRRSVRVACRGGATAAEVTRAVLEVHLLLWDPVWLLGGLLFLATGEHYRRRR
jgi:hypothetical protein